MSKININFILACDIGGTNTRIGIFKIAKTPKLIELFFYKTKGIDLHEDLKKTLDYASKKYNAKISGCCIAAAGPLSTDKDRIEVTNADFMIDKKKIKRKTGLKKIILLNDFEAIGYGINLLGQKDIMAIKKGKITPKAPVILAGAGTGLGKTTLIYDEHSDSYVPIPSEAGHSDFPASSKMDLELAEFLNKKNKSKSANYEHILSGNGLKNIYTFLEKKMPKSKYAGIIRKSRYNPEIISKYKKIDMISAAAFGIFKNTYATFLRNCAIDSLAYGGIYITGAISINNRDIFDNEFISIFKENRRLKKILEKIPICLVVNPNVGLLGAAYAFLVLKKRAVVL